MNSYKFLEYDEFIKIIQKKRASFKARFRFGNYFRIGKLYFSFMETSGWIVISIGAVMIPW